MTDTTTFRVHLLNAPHDPHLKMKLHYTLSIEELAKVIEYLEHHRVKTPTHD